MTLNSQEISLRNENSRIFEDIEGEIAILIACTKLNFTTCKINEKTLKLTLDYIEDTMKIINLLKKRVSLLIEATG